MNTLFDDWAGIGATLWLQSGIVALLGLLIIKGLEKRGAVLQMLTLRATILGVTICIAISTLAASRVQTRWNLIMPSRDSAPVVMMTPLRLSIAPPRASAATEPGAISSKPQLETSYSSQPEIAVTTDVPAVAVPKSKLEAFFTWGNVYQSAVYVWMFGAVLGILWLLLCALNLMRLRLSSTRISSGDWYEELTALCTSHSWRQPLLLQSSKVRSPLLMGLLRPAIVIPCEDVFDSSSRRAVLLHEITHLQRRDLWWIYLTRVLCAILWTQPLLWVLGRELERVAEDVCDEAVVRAGCPPRDYARCLLDLSERLTLRAGERTLAAGVVPRKSALGQRVRRILDERRRGVASVTRPMRVLTALMTLVAIIGATSAVAVRQRLNAQTIVGPLSSSSPWQEPLVEKRLPFRPQSQTVNGVTIRVLDARWEIPEWKRVNEASGSNDFQKQLKVRYEVVRGDSNARMTPANQMLENVKGIYTFDEDGSKVNPSHLENGVAAAFNEVDPRRASFPLEFEFLNPAAPPSATGTFENTLEFKNVPMPQKRDTVLRIGRVLTTKNGTRVFLQAIAIASASAKGYQLFGITNRVLMSMRTLPPAKIPDMTANLSIDSANGANGFIGVNGERLVKNYGNGWSGEDMLEDSDNTVTLFLDPLPNLKVRRVNIRIHVSEEATSLKQKKWFRLFRFQLPQNQISLGNVKPQRPLATADADDIRLTLEPLQRFDNDYKTNLYIVNKSGTNWDWKANSLTINGGTERSLDNNSPIALWKQNGHPVAAREKCLRLEFDTFGIESKGKPAPKTLKMQLQLQGEKRQSRVVNFRNLPVPRGEQNISVNRTVKFASGAWFTIRKIESGTFDNEQRAIQNNKQPTKIAITYDTNAQSDSERWVDLVKSIGVDNLGHSLRTQGLSQSGQTLYFVPPALNAKTFDLRLLLAEVTRGPRKTVVFRDLSVPQEKTKTK